MTSQTRHALDTTVIHIFNEVMLFRSLANHPCLGRTLPQTPIPGVKSVTSSVFVNATGKGNSTGVRAMALT